MRAKKEIGTVLESSRRWLESCHFDTTHFRVRTLARCYDALASLYRIGTEDIRRAADIAVRLHGTQLFVQRDFSFYRDSEDPEEDDNNNEAHCPNRNHVPWPENDSDNEMMTVD